MKKDKKIATPNDFYNAASELETLGLNLDKFKDPEKIPKKDLLDLIIKLAIISAKIAGSHFTVSDVVRNTIKELRWVFYVALIALFKNEIISLISAIAHYAWQYIQYGQYVFKNLSFDQIFQVVYVSPVVIIITYLSQKDNRDNLAKSVKKILSKFN